MMFRKSLIPALLLLTLPALAGDKKVLRIDSLIATQHDGVMGHFTFTNHRDPGSTEGVVVLTMQGGKFVIAPKSS